MMRLIVLLLFLLFSSVAVAEKMAVIRIHNPYGIRVALEVKCDWDPISKRFVFVRKVVVPKRSQYTFIIPRRHVRGCEIWPKVLF